MNSTNVAMSWNKSYILHIKKIFRLSYSFSAYIGRVYESLFVDIAKCKKFYTQINLCKHNIRQKCFTTLVCFLLFISRNWIFATYFWRGILFVLSCRIHLCTNRQCIFARQCLIWNALYACLIFPSPLQTDWIMNSSFG